MKYVSAVLLSFFVFACASPEGNIHYYLLDSADNHTATTEIDRQIPVVLASVQLADYLNKVNLVMKVAENQLYYSERDVWAESLQAGIYKALLRDLNSQAKQTHYMAMNSPNARQVNKSLVVEFSHFMATDESKVIASGQYWLLDKTDLDKTVRSHNFSYTLALHQDGYAHAVSQLSVLLDLLSQDIVKQVE